MRWQSLGLLAFILAALGAAYYALETKGTLFRSDTNRLFQADEKDVEKITITRGEARIVLKREGNLSADQAGGWRLIEPVQATADASETTSLLRTLLESTEERRIEEAPSRLADYGLERPSLQLSVTLKNQKTLPALLLGDLNPNGRSVYAKRPDQPAVFLATVIVRVRADRTPDDFRDKTLLALEPNQVTQVELAGTRQPISLSQTAGKGWEMSKPIKARADAAVIGRLLWKIKDARVTAFVGSGADAKRKYGLERPDLIVEIKDAGNVKRLLLKKAADPQVGVYAMAEPGEDVVTLDAAFLDSLPNGPDAFKQATPSTSSSL
ncbi:MAG: DUF4340 domain-containing protein [bacterium]|uniref:DUF4340 domain-containing protein n=1 Tax=Candidatus Methylomirabilis tolerans TaxID=3123416 RepID=A0AAJ1AHB7_9BACT|nr:DUF4340 domain-containing protein [Candidatus Methylomirabilis sp.]